MGFDVLYLPPIHPIGRVARKGRNNSTSAAPGDAGSPWAIGAAEGGHDAIHPDLGTLDDLRALVAARRRARHRGRARPRLPVLARPPLGHRAPRVVPRTGPTARSSTPRTRRSGTRTSTRSTSRPRTGARCGTRSPTVIDFWIDQGVRIFRVDNPHTKPFAFWEWLIAEVHARHPDVDLPRRGVHPAQGDAPPGQGRLHPVLHLLHLAQLARRAGRVLHRADHGPSVREYFRPNFWPNTPDILTGLPADRRPPGVHRPARAGGHAVAELRHLRPGLRAGRERAGARPAARSTSTRRSTRSGTGTASGAGRLRRPDRARQPHPARAPGAAAQRVAALPSDRQRRSCSCYSKTDAAAPATAIAGAWSTSTRATRSRAGPICACGTSGSGPSAFRRRRPPRRDAHRGAGPATSSSSTRTSCRRTSSRSAARCAPSTTSTTSYEPSRSRTRTTTRSGTRTRSSTSCTCGRSPTATATASAISRAWSHKLDYLQRPRRHRASGCCRSTRRRCATTATTSPTTRASTRPTARPARLPHASCARPTAAACGSSPSWCSTTPPTSTRGSSARGAARPGSRWRDFYVWSDTADRYHDARIIFKDFETSNWTWDPVAGAYYWHRFYSHQPDLNFDNPEVRAAMLRAVDFWLELGVDGLRLDAVPYLFEREGTNCENLPETHAFLQAACGPTSTRASPAACCWPRPTSGPRTPRPTSATATSATWPSTSRSCRACSWRCAWRTASRSSTSCSRRRRSPTTASGRIFLRNHDELTLEMVTDEERDYMYRVYADRPADAHQPRASAAGWRRCCGNDRRKIELMNGLLFSLPGTPVIYYGDEIGMGDNVYLGDRDGVRTPMQWSPGPQRRVLGRQPAAALPAGHHRPRVPLRDGQRRDPAAEPGVAAVVDAAHHRPAAAATRCSAAASIEFLPPENHQGARLRPRRRGRADPGRGQPVALRPARRARPLALARAGAASSCSARRRSRPSASCRTCSRSARTTSTGCAWRSRCAASRPTTAPRRR